jgi:hypothetical protein
MFVFWVDEKGKLRKKRKGKKMTMKEEREGRKVKK